MTKKSDNIIEMDVPKQDDQAVRIDLEKQLESAKKAYDAKMEGAHSHFVAQCNVASEKYLTVNGIMQAVHTYRDVTGETVLTDDMYEKAVSVARSAAILIDNIVHDFLQEEDPSNYERVMDNRIAPDFAAENQELDAVEIVLELVYCQILQNLGPALDDMKQFHEAAQEEIAKLEAELKAL